MLLLVVMTGFTTFSQETSKAEVPENFRNGTATDTTNIADIKWKSFFEETDLVKLIDAALAKNNELQIAEKNIPTLLIIKISG